MLKQLRASDMLLKVEEIYKKYPRIKDTIGWSEEDFEMFYESFLLKGDIENQSGKKILKIDTDSLEKLMTIYDDVQKENQKINKS